MTDTLRERVLRDGIDLTTGDRNRTYGSPAPNLTLQLRLWELYNAAAGGKHTSAHDAAMQHIFAKVARIACGQVGHRDNYVDLATYAAIAYECSVEPAGQVGCEGCGYVYPERLGRYGCPNCLGELHAHALEEEAARAVSGGAYETAAELLTAANRERGL